MNQPHLIPLEDTPTFGFAHVSASLLNSIIIRKSGGRKEEWMGKEKEWEEGICTEDCSPPHKPYHSIKVQLKCHVLRD